MVGSVFRGVRLLFWRYLNIIVLCFRIFRVSVRPFRVCFRDRPIVMGYLYGVLWLFGASSVNFCRCGLLYDGLSRVVRFASLRSGIFPHLFMEGTVRLVRYPNGEWDDVGDLVVR